MAIHTEVLIAGAGPAGLMLAGDLAAAGVRCTVAERRTGESNLTRAFAVHPRTLEELDARGIADELIARGTPVRGLKMFGQSELSLGALPSRFPFTLVTPQYETERVLAGRARAAGAEIRTGAEVIGLRQDGDLVEVEVQRAGGTQRRTIRAAYVVGADGANSTVRSAMGLPFPGHAVVRSVMLADVPLAEKPTGTVAANSTGDAFALIAPFGDGWFRVVAWSRDNQQPDDAPVGADEIRATVRQVFGTDYGMGEPRWLSRFHSDERQVPQYRVGRVFLAGDAAHVHSPAGGQGMNTGIQDAANLGWKLAAVVRGWAGDGSARHLPGRTAPGRRTGAADEQRAAAGGAAARPGAPGGRAIGRGAHAEQGPAAGQPHGRGHLRPGHQLPRAPRRASADRPAGGRPAAGRRAPAVRGAAERPVPAGHPGRGPPERRAAGWFAG